MEPDSDLVSLLWPSTWRLPGPWQVSQPTSVRCARFAGSKSGRNPPVRSPRPHLLLVGSGEPAESMDRAQHESDARIRHLQIVDPIRSLERTLSTMPPADICVVAGIHPGTASRILVLVVDRALDCLLPLALEGRLHQPDDAHTQVASFDDLDLVEGAPPRRVAHDHEQALWNPPRGRARSAGRPRSRRRRATLRVGIPFGFLGLDARSGFEPCGAPRVPRSSDP